MGRGLTSTFTGRTRKRAWLGGWAIWRSCRQGAVPHGTKTGKDPQVYRHPDLSDHVYDRVRHVEAHSVLSSRRHGIQKR